MKMNKTLLALGATAMLSATAIAATQAEYEQALNAAKTAQQAAAAIKGEWRDTGKLLKQAAAAAEKGDYAKAVDLARAAEAQGKLGEQQAKEQAGIGNAGYLYN